MPVFATSLRWNCGHAGTVLVQVGKNNDKHCMPVLAAKSASRFGIAEIGKLVYGTGFIWPRTRFLHYFPTVANTVWLE